MFYVDDRFHASDPVLRIPRARRASAVGLWTLAGAWSRHFLKDGYVPAHMVEELGGAIEDADALIEVGLWRRGRGGGYQFTGWGTWQDTREKVETKRAQWRERQDRSRGKTLPPPEIPEDGPADVTRDSPTSSSSSSSSTDRQIDLSGGTSRRAPATPDGSSSPHGDEPVDSMRPDLERIAARLRDLVDPDVEIGPMIAAMVAEEFLGRAPTPPRMATRYVLTCITRHANAVANYIHTGRWSE